MQRTPRHAAKPKLKKPPASGPPEHDTLVHRLTQILIKLNRGEPLYPRELAAEFGVDVRTVQRDLNQRFASLDLVKKNGTYQLDPLMLGKLGTQDIARFASIAGVAKLFPALSHSFVSTLLAAGGDDVILVRGHAAEDARVFEDFFARLRGAAADHRFVSFDLVSSTDGRLKRFEEVAPYRLLNTKGIWYLAARHHGRTKLFGLSRIRSLAVSGFEFAVDPAALDAATKGEGLWHSDHPIAVRVKVAAQVASYFLRRNLIAGQVLERTCADGSLVLSAEVGHINEILPIVKYWIPHLEILDPQEVRSALLAELGTYIKSAS